MEEDLDCIPFIDGVVHEAHPYTPQDHDEELWCGGITEPDHEGPYKPLETRWGGRYRIAMKVNYSGVDALHKMAVADTIEAAREWKKEFEEDVPGKEVLIIWESTEVRSYPVS